MADFFNVVFAGETSGGADPAAVRANMARMFKASDAMIEKLFSGQRIAVKKAVDQATAMKYRAVMKQAGAIAYIEPADEQGRPLAVASAPAAPAPVSVPAAPARPAAPQTMAERIAVLAAEQEKAAALLKPKPEAPPADVARAGAWGLFPPGSMLSETNTRPAPVSIPDVSSIKLAARGSDLIKAEERNAPPPVVVDVSAISVAPPNTELLKESERRVVVPVVVDVSGITIAPPGVDLEQIKDDKKPVNPDISKLKLA